MAGIHELPDEILHYIMRSGPACSAIALEQTSMRFRNVANAPLLWRYFCQNDFRFWDPRHNIREKFSRPASTVAWKDLYKTRRRVDRTTTGLLNSVLASQTGRIQKAHRIVGFGYDVKDTLLRHAAADSDEPDYLARRYYSKAILGCLHRTIAIPEWSRLKASEDVPLERALGVFDMFVLETGTGDFDDISMRLSDIVSRIYRDRPDITELTPREKAVSIADYLQVNNLTGLEPGTEFYRVEHNFLGMALTSDGHNSLPLISAAIYCYVARIFGLNANPCGFPFHVHVIIRPDPGYDLDGNCLENGEDAAPMYMDPFRSREETPVSELEAQLNFLGVLTLTHSSHPTFLRESRTPEIILRCANNISESLSQTLRYRHSSIDASLAKYATHWLFMLFADYAGVDENLHGGPTPRQIARLQLGRHLPYLMDLFVTKYPLDVYLIEQYIIPLFRGLPEYEHLLETVRVMKAGDGIPKQVRRRTFENRNLRYRVGQVFRHRRYGYLAVVIGWDTACGTEERWMHRMGADQHRARGRQSLYHALVGDRGVRYVAEENIETLDLEISQIPHALVNLAGRYFKRWDGTTRRFVSNVRDEYPDD